MKKLSFVLIAILVLLTFAVPAAADNFDSTVYANVSKYAASGNLSNAHFPGALGEEVPEGTTLYINVACGNKIKLTYLLIEIDGSSYFEWKPSYPSNYYRWQSLVWQPTAGKHTVKFTIGTSSNTYTATRNISVAKATKTAKSSANSYTFNGNVYTVVPGFSTDYAYNQHDYSRFVNSRGRNRGCTATAMATAYSIYHNSALSPNDVKWSSSGCSWEYASTRLLIQNTFSQSDALKAIKASIENDGRPVIAWVKGAGSDHVVTVVGVRGSGNKLGDFLIIDPLDGEVDTLSAYTGIDTSGSLRVPD